jgi:flavin-dependent dehydrogenase
MLPPAAAPLLQELGVWDAFHQDGHSGSPGIVSAWTDETPYEHDFLFNPYGQGWHLDRLRFDAMLARCAERAGVRVCRGIRVRDCYQLTRGSWKVVAQRGDQPAELRAQFLIDATGRGAWFAQRQKASRHTMDQLVGVVGQREAFAANETRLYLEAVRDGWWYAAPLPGNRSIVVYMTDEDYLPRRREELSLWWHARLNEAPLTARVLRQTSPLLDLHTFAANTTRLYPVWGPGWIAVGDAAAAHDPLSSQGILKALESGMRAGRAVTRWLKGQGNAFADYAAWIEGDFSRYRRHHAFFYGQVTRWPQSRFWQRRQSGLEPV